MADENETLETTASEEQPVETQPVESVESEGTSEGATEVVTPKEETRKYAGKYATVEDLEVAYQRSNAEATRMAQLLSQPRSESKPETQTPKYSSAQLEDFKEGRLLEVSQAQALASRLYAEGNYPEAQKYEQAAKTAASQIRMIDAELRKMEIEQYSGSQRKVAAEDRIRRDAQTVLSQYKDQIVPGTELHSKASELLDNFVAMGMDGQSDIVQAQAVSLAAQALGLQAKGVASKTRKELTQTISQALKDGVASGAGKAAKAASTPNFEKMTSKEFREYKIARGMLD